MAQILTRKAWNLPNPSCHQIRAKRHRLEPLNQPRSKRIPQRRRWAASWSRKSTEAAAHRCPCSEEGSHRCEPSWSHSPSRFASGQNPVDPHIILPQNPHVTVPRSAWERNTCEPPMALSRQACAPPPSTRFDVTRSPVDGGPGLDHRYPSF
jgi:hypothetical protein